MKYHLKYYDERRNLIGRDESQAPPGTSYVTIGMEVTPGDPSPVPGYQLTSDEAAEVLAESEQRTQAHQHDPLAGPWSSSSPNISYPTTTAAHVSPQWHVGLTVEPAPGQPIFGRDGREVGSTEEFPLTSFCRCGRQITQLGMKEVWEHSD